MDWLFTLDEQTRVRIERESQNLSGNTKKSNIHLQIPQSVDFTFLEHDLRRQTPG